MKDANLQRWRSPGVKGRVVDLCKSIQRNTRQQPEQGIRRESCDLEGMVIHKMITDGRSKQSTEDVKGLASARFPDV
ncbi:hypothetical protein AX14_009369 [Amanita brunnescens Koide BX004]|nr:hypothetical protein AX14_009369 [Amanita brunnescens Koide BX004]